MSSDSAAPRPPAGHSADEPAQMPWSAAAPYGSRSQPYTGAGKRKQVKDPGFIRRHWILCCVVAVASVAIAAGGTWLLYLNNMLGNVDRVGITVDEDNRPPPTHGEELNILLAGADNGPGGSIAESVDSGSWNSGEHRSDTIMILHIPADREDAYLVSIPRDSYVGIYDENGDYAYDDKINAAFSVYGPSGYLSTIEHLTGLRMDHLAIIDWKGFKDLSSALGGVEVYIPETFYDSSQKITWEEGTHQLEGEQALQYVRTRYGLEDGDFGRIARQQNFLRSMMGELLSQGTVSNPLKLTSALRAITDNLTVDEDWSGSGIRDLALQLRDIRTDDVTFLTAPTAGYDTTEDGASVVLLDENQSKTLWESIADDDIDGYLDKYGGEAGKLAKPEAVQ
jgi:LCP family protein required for cell wall assembly